jgi:hypothetical protein
VIVVAVEVLRRLLITKSLIAVMLGRLRMSVADCIDAYISLSARVFRKTRQQVTYEDDFLGLFDSQRLGRAVMRIIEQQGFDKNMLLEDTSDNACKVYVVYIC